VGLTDSQLEKLDLALLVATYGPNEERIKQERRRLELEARLVVDSTAEALD
jgi:hypothetical protein